MPASPVPSTASVDTGTMRNVTAEHAAASGFSLCTGGPVYFAGCRLGIAGGARHLWQFGVAIAIITWLPLVILDAFTASQQPVTISFLHSLGTHVRLLFAIPMLFTAEALFDTRVPNVLRRILEIRMVLPEDMPRLMAALRTAVRRRDSWLMECALIALTGMLIWAGLRTDVSVDVTTWRTSANGELTPAGWWYTLVSIPMFQFLLWRWCWRLLIWGEFLWKLSRLNLQLVPTHPDGAGGLAVLGVIHVDLAPLSLAGSAVLSSNYAEQILYANIPLRTFAVSLTATMIGSAIALIVPLAFFTPRLIDTKQRGLLEYGTLASHYTRAFAAKWMGSEQPEEPMLGTADIQSLADLGNSFGFIRNMSVLPIGRAADHLHLYRRRAAVPAPYPDRLSARAIDHRQREVVTQRLDRTAGCRRLDLTYPTGHRRWRSVCHPPSLILAVPDTRDQGRMQRAPLRQEARRTDGDDVRRVVSTGDVDRNHREPRARGSDAAVAGTNAGPCKAAGRNAARVGAILEPAADPAEQFLRAGGD